MHYTEAKEHVQGRLHDLFSDPYAAFDNDSQERLLHIRVMLYLLAFCPMERGLLTLRVLHGWENGNDDPQALICTDYPLGSLEAFNAAVADFYGERSATSHPLLGPPLAQAIATARRGGQPLDDAIIAHPASWPAFAHGLTLYTLFKMYHRLVYGEDDFYRSSRCQTDAGLREIHEFHLEEGEFAFLLPPHSAAAREETRLILHESQLKPFQQLLEDTTSLFHPL
ncbi:hypothetical protein GCM10022228_02630 [Halomonas cibimaris]|uniref:Uncharacterized protein n=1 Tax=Halomonas cibimaris TaxID=657012 RepID=A0ABP7L6J4_9GAMM